MAKSSLIIHDFEGFSVPIKIVREWRTSIRVSVNRSNAILRLPHGLLTSTLISEVEKAKVWITKTILKDPEDFKRFLSKAYPSEFEKVVMDQAFKVSILRTKRKTSTGSIKSNELKIKIFDELHPFQEKEVIKKLQSRLFAKYFKERFEQRVHQLNNLYYGFDFKTIRLKYNQSNWGSCSSANNLNFSTKLLITPLEVRDYVIVHELAHLKEMNHSAKFWQVVATALPNYKQQEKWLKDHGSSCDF